MNTSKATEAGRPASNPKPWGFDDLAELVEYAGLRPIDTIAEWIGKDPEQVDTAAFLLGLDVSLACPALVWCDECASWRTKLNLSGRCPVCALTEQLARREAAVAEALELLTPKDRAIYAESETLRERRKEEALPILTVPENADRRQRKALAAFQAAATEQWECRRLIKDYDAAKTRLRRIREKSGTNPRKGNSRG